MLLAFLLFWLLTPPSIANTPPSDDEMLKRGISLSHWLNYWGRQPITRDDLKKIRAAGFDHVRIPVDPLLLGWSPDTAGSGPARIPLLSRLDRAVDLAGEEGLVALIDIHPGESFKKRIEQDQRAEDAFVAFWDALAIHYADYPEQALAFEVLNEPSYWVLGEPERWRKLRQRLVSSIRKVDEHHLILVSGSHGGGMGGLLEDEPLEGNRVAYTVHYYEPMILTHLGATWEPFKSGIQGKFTGLHYPVDSSAHSVIAVKSPGDRPIVESAVRDYEQEQWGPERIRKDFARMQQWRDRYDVRIILGEFGIHRSLAAQTRSAWIRDVRLAAEKYHMAWTLWDYADHFGIAEPIGPSRLAEDGVPLVMDEENPSRRMDSGLLLALGLKAEGTEGSFKKGEIDPRQVQKYSPLLPGQDKSPENDFCHYDADCPPTYACTKENELSLHGSCVKARR